MENDGYRVPTITDGRVGVRYTAEQGPPAIALLHPFTIRHVLYHVEKDVDFHASFVFSWSNCQSDSHSNGDPLGTIAHFWAQAAANYRHFSSSVFPFGLCCTSGLADSNYGSRCWGGACRMLQSRW